MFSWRNLLTRRSVCVFAGAGESGKSTVLKQMKLIYTQGFSKNEKLEWKPVVYNNIIQSFRVIFDAMNELGIQFENKDNEACFTQLRQTMSKPPTRRIKGVGMRSGLTVLGCCRRMSPAY